MFETYHHLPRIQASQGSPARDEACEDSAWSEYMEEADKHDARVSDAWKDDANGVLVFAGLFSATVATFIIESYTMLSSDSDDKTACCPSLPIIWVNSLWLLSLVFSISSALVATLVQQWARRYIQLPQIPNLPSERARIRAFLFLGTSVYPMQGTVTAAQALLHLSVFFFFVGLAIFIFAISETVAIIVSICVGLFGFMYLLLTILPCFDHRCPYCTPMSNAWWYVWHASMFSVALCARWILRSLSGVLIPYDSGDTTSPIQRCFNNWWPLLDDAIEKHKRRLKDGLLGSIFRAAVESSEGINPTALIRLLNALTLADTNEVEDFVASISGDTIIQLICALPHGNIFYRHLSTLMRSCAPGTTVHDEDVRKRRLVVCLNAFHHISRACNTEVLLPEYLLEDVRIKFANIAVMRALWADEDPAIRITSRSICALLARHILRNRRTRNSESRLLWLQDVLGESSNTIISSLETLITADKMNVDAFVYGVLSYPTGDLPVAQVARFVDTLAILMNTGSNTAIHRKAFEEGVSGLVRRAECDDRLHAVVDKLRKTSELVFPFAAPEPST